MTVLAHCVAILCYVGAAMVAAAPIARPVVASVRGVRALLALGVAFHLGALAAVGRAAGQAPVAGLGPALSFAGLLLAATLLLVEGVARDVSLSVVAAPLAAIVTLAAAIVGLRPAVEPSGADGLWVVAHIALSFAGLAAVATAAAAGVLYLAQHHRLKTRHFASVFRFFPPLDTLDRMNYWGVMTGWVALTLGTALAVAYSAGHAEPAAHKIVWGTAAWMTATGLALGRVWRRWQARRAALAASLAFGSIVALYVAFRVAGGNTGKFL